MLSLPDVTIFSIIDDTVKLALLVFCVYIYGMWAEFCEKKSGEQYF